jgi:hypothetical protein
MVAHDTNSSETASRKALRFMVFLHSPGLGTPATN